MATQVSYRNSLHVKIVTYKVQLCDFARDEFTKVMKWDLKQNGSVKDEPKHTCPRPKLCDTNVLNIHLQK